MPLKGQIVLDFFKIAPLLVAVALPAYATARPKIKPAPEREIFGLEGPEIPTISTVLVESRLTSTPVVLPDARVIWLNHGAQVQWLPRLGNYGAQKPCTQVPESLQNELLACVQVGNEVGLIPRQFLMPDSLHPTPALGDAGWQVLRVPLVQVDCFHEATWLLGPAGQRFLLAEEWPIEVQVRGDQIIWHDNAAVYVASLPEAASPTVYAGFTAATVAPDRSLWLRKANDGLIAHNEQDIYRVVDGEPRLVWAIKRWPKEKGDLPCERDLPMALEFSADGRRAKVDGKWRAVPSLANGQKTFHARPVAKRL